MQSFSVWLKEREREYCSEGGSASEGGVYVRNAHIYVTVVAAVCCSHYTVYNKY